MFDQYFQPYIQIHTILFRCILTGHKTPSYLPTFCSIFNNFLCFLLSPFGPHVPEAPGAPGIGGQAVGGTGWGQQNQTFRFMPVSQPEVVGIQKQGPYRRIKPIMLSKTISSCEYLLTAQCQWYSAVTEHHRSYWRSDPSCCPRAFLPVSFTFCSVPVAVLFWSIVSRTGG